MGAVHTSGGAAVELRLTGTQTGTLHSPYGTVAPTGRVVSWEVADVVRARRGRITAWRSYFDWSQLLDALGVQFEGLSRAAQHDALALPV
ncbi:ester cyclase [Micromonospora tarensis]|nr:ester cyclase [Micromonospora tarensis]